MESHHSRGPHANPSGVENFELFQADPLGFLARLAAEYGDFIRFTLGTTPRYLINQPTLVRQLFVDNEQRIQKPAFVANSNRGYWGDGLTTLEGEPWRVRRALMRPVFRASSLPRQVSIITECTGDMLSSWRRGQTVALRTELRILTARIAARVLFDAELEGFGSPESNRRRAGVIRFEEAFGEDFTAVNEDDPDAPLTMRRPRAPKKMDSTLALIEDRLKSEEDRGDVLSLLRNAALEDGTRLTREEIIGEIIQMFFSGHLTMPVALTSFWRALALNPQVARQIHQEAKSLPLEVFASMGGGPPTWCELALKETLRMFPPAPILFREVRSPFTLNGHVLEPRTAVWVCPHMLHHDGRSFHEPELFRPERFAPENAGRIPDYAYLPFGAGSRACAGRRQAMMQMSIIGLMVARLYSLHPALTAGQFEIDEPC